MRRLTQQHRTAITLLIAGKKQIEVAKDLNVDVVTVANWLKDGLFTEMLEQEREKWTREYLRLK